MKTLRPGNSIQRASTIDFFPIKFPNPVSSWQKLIALLAVTAFAD
jgi:hypothetical protein